MAPVYAVLATPLGRLHIAVTEVVNLRYMREESSRLGEENEKLRRWQTIALAASSSHYGRLSPVCRRLRILIEVWTPVALPWQFKGTFRGISVGCEFRIGKAKRRRYLWKRKDCQSSGRVPKNGTS